LQPNEHSLKGRKAGFLSFFPVFSTFLTFTVGPPSAKTGMVAWHSVGRSSSCYLSWCWTQGKNHYFQIAGILYSSV